MLFKGHTGVLTTDNKPLKITYHMFLLWQAATQWIW